MKFINFAIQNEQGLALKAKKTYTGMANLRVNGLLDADTKRSLVTTPENFAKTLVGDDRWWAANRQDGSADDGLAAQGLIRAAHRYLRGAGP